MLSLSMVVIAALVGPMVGRAGGAGAYQVKHRAWL